VKHNLVKVSLISCCALIGTHVFAQSAGKASVDAAKMQTAAASAKAAKPVVAAATTTAAGSVIVLADGIVANAALAKIQPPADGFVYER
jgi:ribosomal protein S11